MDLLSEGRGGERSRSRASMGEGLESGGGLLQFHPPFKPVHSHRADGEPCSVLFNTGFLRVFDTPWVL